MCGLVVQIIKCNKVDMVSTRPNIRTFSLDDVVIYSIPYLTL
jgi:hypothetical protein